MKYLTLLFGIAAVLSSRAEITAEQSILGGSENDCANIVIQAASGGYAMAGFTESTDGDIVGLHHGGKDAWIVRLDEEGNIEWQVLLGGSMHDIATGIVELPAGELIVCGHTWSADGDFPLHQGTVSTSDIFLAKISPAGQLIWTHTFGSDYNDEANDVAYISNNRIALGGTVTGTGTDVEAILGMKDIWLASLDGNGNLLWENTYGGIFNDELHHIAPCPDGGIYLAGCSDSYSDLAGDREGVVIKTDNDGEIQWTVSLGSTADNDDAQMSSFHSTENGDLKIGFTTTGTESDGVNCTPHGSVMIAHITAEGEVTDHWCYGGSALEYAVSVHTDAEGAHWILSDTRSTDGHVNASENNTIPNYSGWLIKCNDEGEILENAVLGTSSNDYSAVVVKGENTRALAVLNTFSGEANSGGQVTDQTVPTSDVMLVFLTPDAVHIEENEHTPSALICPNPANDQLVFEITDTESPDDREGIIVRDAVGRMIGQFKMTSNRLSIATGQWESGVYYFTHLSSGKSWPVVISHP
ncbi:MAG: hypothetical protein ACK500_06010 [Flavobacteriales bacterium]